MSYPEPGPEKTDRINWVALTGAIAVVLMLCASVVFSLWLLLQWGLDH